MPSSITIRNSNAPRGEINAISPTIFIDQYLRFDYICENIINSSGALPSKATIKFVPDDGGNKLETNGNITLKYSFFEEHGSRVFVIDDKILYFVGTLMQREDQGAADTRRWVAVDDRHLLMRIPIRGCVVKDGIDNIAKMIRRFVARTNPNGLWNCTGCTINGTVYPVFTDTAFMGKTYESPDETFNKELKDNGEITPWTPRRFLQYLNLLANIDAGDMAGIKSKHWRSLKNSERLQWDASSISGMIGHEGGRKTKDPLDRKMPDMTFAGQNMMTAITDTLKVVGTHELKVTYDLISITSLAANAQAKIKAKTKIDFYPKLISGKRNNANRGKIILLQRDGVPDKVGANTAFDFQLLEDGLQTSEAVLVEGDSIRMETRVEYDGIITNTNQSLLPAWTQNEEVLFLQIIYGNGIWAKMPKGQQKPDANTTTTEFVLMDGNTKYPTNQTLPPTKYKSPEAVALARSILPRVFRAFYLNSEFLSDTMSGAGEFNKQPFKDKNIYPVLKYKRPILPTQLQYQIKDINLSDGILNSLKSKYPVRIEVAEAFGMWHDSSYQNGVRVTGDGLLWLDGLGEGVDGLAACIYNGSLIIDPLTVTMKPIRINCAFPLDHRTDGYIETQPKKSNFKNQYASDLGGAPLLYIDSPNMYHEEHQRGSLPTSHMEYISGSSNLEAPLNRILPPGSEAIHAFYAAQRRYEETKSIKKLTSWRMIGIRNDYHVGDWVSEVLVANDTILEGNYKIDAPVQQITLDFINQLTNIGGLFTEV